MFLINLVKIDFNHVFNQTFRLLLSITSVICYCLLVTLHAFIMRPLYKVCGNEYFSLISRWIFSDQSQKPLAARYNDFAVVCYLTNVHDLTMLSLGLLYCALFLMECFLLRRKRRQLLSLIGSKAGDNKQRDRQRRSTRLTGDLADTTPPDPKIMRHRLHKKSSTTRFIGRLAILLPSGFLSTIHLISSLISYLMFHLGLQALSTTESKDNENYIEAIKWRTVIYLFLSFFLCGFYWSMVGVNTSMLQAIYSRSRRQSKFRRMNTRMFSEGSTII